MVLKDEPTIKKGSAVIFRDSVTGCVIFAGILTVAVLFDYGFRFVTATREEKGGRAYYLY